MTVRTWGGFSDDRIWYDYDSKGEPSLLSVYRTRRQARNFYQDVRRVEIREVRK